MSKTRGHCGSGRKSPTYSAWSNMRDRCNSPTHHAYKNYGGRGISYCKRWEIFANFLDDMGEKPEGMTLERKNTNADYCKENCEWIPRNEQSKNMRTSKRWTINGVTYDSLRAAERETGINDATIARRTRAGIPGYSCSDLYPGGMK